MAKSLGLLDNNSRRYRSYEEEIIEEFEELDQADDYGKGPQLEEASDLEDEAQDIGDQYEQDMGMEGEDEEESMEYYNLVRAVEDYEEDMNIDSGDSEDDEPTVDEEVTEEAEESGIDPDPSDDEVVIAANIEGGEVEEEDIEEDAVDEEGNVDTVAAVENYLYRLNVRGLENIDETADAGGDNVHVTVETGEVGKDIVIEPNGNISIGEMDADGGDMGDAPEGLDGAPETDNGQGGAAAPAAGGDAGLDQSGTESWNYKRRGSRLGNVSSLLR